MNMKRQNSNEMPTYLRDLTREPPSGIIKLLAAWDALNSETQIQLLTDFFQTWMPNELIKKALSSSNVYIRYLAARRGNDEDEEIDRLIKGDKDSLVRYARLENIFDFSAGDFLSKRIEFFSMPQEARLSFMRGLTTGGKEIAELMKYALAEELPNKRITIQELDDLLYECIGKPEFKEAYKELPFYLQDPFGGVEFEDRQDLEALWRLVPDVPEKISMRLINNLPVRKDDPDIPEEVLNKMTDRQLSLLFAREDIRLKEFRKKIFFNTSDRHLQRDAAYFHFDLTYDECNKILKKPIKERNTFLDSLSDSKSTELRLPILQGLIDTPNELITYTSWSLQKLLEKRLSTLNTNYQLTGEHREEVLHLRLYKLAKEYEYWNLNKEKTDIKTEEVEFFKNITCPWSWKEKRKESIKNKMVDLCQDALVPGDAWQTFMNFCEQWKHHYCDSIFPDDVEQILPRIADFEPDELDELADEYERLGLAPSQIFMRKRINEILYSIRNEFSGKTMDNEKNLKAVTLLSLEKTLKFIADSQARIQITLRQMDGMIRERSIEGIEKRLFDTIKNNKWVIIIVIIIGGAKMLNIF